MSVLECLAKIDFAAVQFEKAKREIENAKVNFERAKQGYEEVLTQAESLGLSKAKLKRVAEERVNALIDCGLLDMGKDIAPVAKKSSEVKSDKQSKLKKKSRNSEENQEEFEESTFEANVDKDSDERNVFKTTEATM